MQALLASGLPLTSVWQTFAGKKHLVTVVVVPGGVCIVGCCFFGCRLCTSFKT